MQILTDAHKNQQITILVCMMSSRKVLCHKHDNDKHDIPIAKPAHTESKADMQLQINMQTPGTSNRPLIPIRPTLCLPRQIHALLDNIMPSRQFA